MSNSVGIVMSGLEGLTIDIAHAQTEDNEAEHRTNFPHQKVVGERDSTNSQPRFPKEESEEVTSGTTDTASTRQCRSASVEAICDQCRGLNLDALIRTFRERRDMARIYPAPWVSESPMKWPVASVGHRYRILSDPFCILCRLLNASRVHPKLAQDQDEGDTIRLEPFTRHSFMKQHHDFDLTKAICLLVIPPNFSGAEEAISRHIKFNGCAVVLPDSEVSELCIPKPITPKFDANVVRSWLQYCALHHPPSCHPKNLPVWGVQVIDCETLLIESWNTNTRYVSLSYVWGASGDTTRTCETMEGQKSLPHLLPLVINDAIAVTKALGYRYLWIDKFCIDQDSPDLKHDQISQMDVIYFNSDITIIAAAGCDETYGLPGVGARDRSHQLTTKLADAIVLHTPRDVHTVIARSSWSTRGWTFQEAILSRRALVFTEDQAYFQCSTMNCFESAGFPLDEMHMRGGSRTHENIRAGFFGRSNYHNFGKHHDDRHILRDLFGYYLSNVEDYTGRTLRFESDSLNAFQGIIRRFSQERIPFKDVWGLAYPAGASEVMTCFVHSLTWLHQKGTAPGRRAMFPSWTWAGWRGPIKYVFYNSQHVMFENGIYELRFRTNSGETLDLATLGDIRDVPILQLRARVVTLDWRILMSKSRLSWSASPQNEAELLESFKNTSRWQLIYIGSFETLSFVMVLELCEVSQIWQRAGMFLVEAFASTFSGGFGEQIIRTFDIR